MISRLHFLSRGCTKAHFQSFAKCPVSKDKLTILVNSTGSNTSKHTDKIADGIGSSAHDFLFAKASLRTSSSGNGENSERNVMSARVYFNVQFYTKCAVLNPFV